MATEHPYYWSTSLILNFEDAGATTFTDISPTPKTPASVNGNAVNSATQFRSGSKSLYLDGAGDWIDYAAHSGYEFGDGAFTVSCWFRPSALGITQMMANYTIDAASTDAHVAWYMRISTTNKIDCAIYIGGVKKNIVSNTSLVVDTWHHLEFSRDASGVCRIFLNGVSDATSIPYPGLIQAPANRLLRIGRYSATNPFYPNGYIDGLAITKGYAVNTTTFVPSGDLYGATPPATATAAVALPAWPISAFSGGRASANLPSLSAVAFGSARAEVAIPMFGIQSSGHDATGERSAKVSIPMFGITSRGGATARVALPMFGVGASITVPVSVDVRVTLPKFSIESSGTVGVLASANVTIPRFGIASGGGGRASVDIPMFAIESGGVAGAVGRAFVTLPMFGINASGTAGIVITARVEIPAIESTPSMRASVQIPMFGIVAIARAVVTITYEAYAINLQPGNKARVHEVTHYTGQPFTGIVRWKDDYYGWGPGGLYLIGGDTDAGQAIPWAWHTAVTNFGSRQEKRVAETFIHGRLGPTASATVSVGEAAQATYRSVIHRGSNGRAHRVKYERGPRGQYWSFGLSDVNGSTGDVESMQHEPQQLTRKI